MGSEQWLIVANHSHSDNTPTGKLILHAQGMKTAGAMWQMVLQPGELPCYRGMCHTSDCNNLLNN